MAEQAAKYRVSKGEAIAQMLQSLGQSGGQAMQSVGQAIGQKRQNSITPEQMKGLQQFAMAPAPLSGEKQTFQGGIDPTKRLNPAQQKFLVDTMAQKQTEDRMMALQGLKGTQQVNMEDLKTSHKKEIEDLKAQHAKDIARLRVGALNVNEDDRKVLTDAAVRHPERFPPDIFKSRGVQPKFIADMLRKDPEYDPTKANTQYKAEQRGATTAAGKSADIITNLNSAHGGFEKSMDAAMPLAGKYSIGYINQILNSGGKGLNDPDAIKLYGHLHLAALNAAKIAKGGNASLSTEEEKGADELFSTKLNENGLQGMRDVVETEYQGRVEGAKRGTSSQSGTSGAETNNAKPHPQDADAVKWAKDNPNDPMAAQILKANGQ